MVFGGTAAKSMKPRATSVWTSSHADAVADIEALESADDPAFGRRPGNAHPGSLVRRAGHDGIEPRADPRGEEQRGRGLRDLPFHLCRIVLLVGAVARERRELVVGVRRRLPAERRLQQALGDEVGKPAVRRRGMRVVLHGQSEVPLGRLAGHFERVFARAQQLDDGQRKVGKAHRVGLAALGQEGIQRSGVRRRRQPLPRLGRQRDDPVPALRRAQHAAQRRQALRSRYLAVTPLAAIMKSSISSFARFFSSGSRSASAPSSNTARTSSVSRCSAPCAWRTCFSACAARSWMRICSSSPGTAASFGGAGAVPSSHAATPL